VTTDPSLPPLHSLVDLLKKFIKLHYQSFAEAVISYIVTKEGLHSFNFAEHVMYFSLDYRNDNPGMAFTVKFADCAPLSLVYAEQPQLKEMLQASEEKYKSVAEFDKASMPHFAGLIRVVFDACECYYVKYFPIRDDHEGDAENRAHWLSELQVAVDNGLVGKTVGDKYQIGKIVKQGSHWKWVPITGLS
jgi:hypothetical protein